MEECFKTRPCSSANSANFGDTTGYRMVHLALDVINGRCYPLAGPISGGGGPYPSLRYCSAAVRKADRNPLAGKNWVQYLESVLTPWFSNCKRKRRRAHAPLGEARA